MSSLPKPMRKEWLITGLTSSPTKIFLGNDKVIGQKYSPQIKYILGHSLVEESTVVAETGTVKGKCRDSAAIKIIGGYSTPMRVSCRRLSRIGQINKEHWRTVVMADDSPVRFFYDIDQGSSKQYQERSQFEFHLLARRLFGSLWVHYCQWIGKLSRMFKNQFTTNLSGKVPSIDCIDGDSRTNANSEHLDTSTLLKKDSISNWRRMHI